MTRKYSKEEIKNFLRFNSNTKGENNTSDNLGGGNRLSISFNKQSNKISIKSNGNNICSFQVNHHSRTSNQISENNMKMQDNYDYMDDIFENKLVSDIMMFKNEKRSSNLIGSLGSLDKGNGPLYQFMEYDEHKEPHNMSVNENAISNRMAVNMSVDLMNNINYDHFQ